MVIGVGLAVGGLTQLLAGMWAFAAGDVSGSRKDSKYSISPQFLERRLAALPSLLTVDSGSPTP